MIIGGGIIGCSIAYHLTAMGETDVVLLEQHQLTDGATWHAAGLVGQLRSSRNTTRMLEHSVELYARLEAETGQAVDWHQVGSLRLACSAERVMELKRLTTMAKSFGLPMEIVSPQRAQELFPLMTTDGVLAAAFLPTDGYIDPASVTQAIAKGARMRNARICEHTRVTSITVDGRRASTVHTDQGDITCEMVVNAAGMWGMEIGRMAGVRIPAVAVEHQYVLTGPDPRLHAGGAASDADDARPRSARLLQARRTGVADRRLRTRHAALRSYGRTDTLPAAVAGAQLRSLRAVGDTGGAAHARDRSGRDPHA